MQTSTELLDVWPRPSASNSIVYYDDTVSFWGGPAIGIQYDFDEFDMMPYEELVSVDSTLYKVQTRGYYYHFIAEYIDGSFPSIDPLVLINEWLPIDPILDTAKMYYSIYISDTTLTSFYDFPCSSPNPLYDDDLGIEDLNQNNPNFILYPNPSNESITIKGSENQLITTVEIFDLNGKLLFYIEPNSKQIEINISNYQKGAYFVKCSDDKIVKTLKLLKI